ncbi:hypothetical protein [Reichenbachiella sp.]|uniref:hypothetical protein n=2 Tax=Reichenbachiella sp. TaxID=2184521 RepID=UPI0032991ED0
MKIALTLLLFTATNSFSQDFVTDLNGFRLGQFRDVPKNELNTIIQEDKFDDGFEYEIFLVEPDTSVYMLFEYANYDLKTIWSIQLTGTKKDFDCGFKGLKLGMSEAEIKSLMGEASTVEDAGDYGDKWIYDNANYSLEISPNGLLAGIKIIDQSQEFYTASDITKIPNFKQYSEILNSDNQQLISDILAPGIEVYKNDSVHYFHNSMMKEINEDGSGIFSLTKELSQILSRVDPMDSLQYEENIRVAVGQATLHVAKIKLDGNYNEIVFRYLFGQYLIWEIQL